MKWNRLHIGYNIVKDKYSNLKYGDSPRPNLDARPGHTRTAIAPSSRLAASFDNRQQYQEQQLDPKPPLHNHAEADHKRVSIVHRRHRQPIQHSLCGLILKWEDTNNQELVAHGKGNL